MTPTTTPTPTPTPTVTPTTTPTPTPTPTVTPTAGAPGPAAGTVFTRRGSLHLTSGHDIVYNGIDFEGAGYGSGDWGALVFLEAQGPLYNITFRNCIFGTNTEGIRRRREAGRSRRQALVHDITFDHCAFKYQPRMGFEMNGRAIENGVGGQGYLRVNLTNCTFDASAGEAISYDSNTGDKSGNCVISGNVVQGAGVGTKYMYGQVFEINGTHNVTVTGNTFYAGRDGVLNLQMHDTSATGWVFSNNVVDATKVPAGVSVTSNAQPVVAFNVYGGTSPATSSPTRTRGTSPTSRAATTWIGARPRVAWPEQRPLSDGLLGEPVLRGTGRRRALLASARDDGGRGGSPPRPLFVRLWTGCICRPDRVDYASNLPKAHQRLALQIRPPPPL